MAQQSMEPVREFRIPADSSIVVSNASVSSVRPSQPMFSSDHLADDPNGTVPFASITEPLCQWVLYWDINNSRVRVWDVMILIPNALFLLFLLGRLRPNVRKLRASTSPIFTAFYGMVFGVSIISILRCVVSMTVNASMEAGNIADRMLWLILRFFLMSTEASVITFGFYFGHSGDEVRACTLQCGSDHQQHGEL